MLGTYEPDRLTYCVSLIHVSPGFNRSRTTIRDNGFTTGMLIEVFATVVERLHHARL